MDDTWVVQRSIKPIWLPDSVFVLGLLDLTGLLDRTQTEKVIMELAVKTGIGYFPLLRPRNFAPPPRLYVIAYEMFCASPA